LRRQKKMELKTFRILISAILLVPFLAGCGEIRSKLGLNKQAPDEFTVLSQAPLSMPPNFALRAPAPGVERAQKVSKMNDVKRVVLKNNSSANKGPDSSVTGSSGEKNLRRLLGADSANKQIREIINEEAADLIYADQRFLDKLLKWPSGSANESLLDAAAESKRIRSNQDAGKTINDGETPVIERGKGNFIKKLFQ
jgi:hypothetical protein